MAKKKKYDPTKYVKPVAPTTPAAYKPMGNFQIGTYNSQYGNQLQSARDTLTNWKYDPMQDASYQALAKVYGARGNIAAKNTLADAAALNGGYGTSYAVSAAQQARNQYNQELAALIPDLEANAYNKATTNYNVWKDADDTDYGRFRDTEGDRQWLYSQQAAENQFQYNANYQRYQDAMDQYQWGKDFDLSLYNLKQAEKGSGGGGGGGGGRRRSGGGGGGYSGGGSSGSSGLNPDDIVKAARQNSGGNDGYAGAYKTNGKSYAGSSAAKTTYSPSEFQKKTKKK